MMSGILTKKSYHVEIARIGAEEAYFEKNNCNEDS